MAFPSTSKDWACWGFMALTRSNQSGVLRALQLRLRLRSEKNMSFDVIWPCSAVLPHLAPTVGDQQGHPVSASQNAHQIIIYGYRRPRFVIARPNTPTPPEATPSICNTGEGVAVAMAARSSPNGPGRCTKLSIHASGVFSTGGEGNTCKRRGTLVSLPLHAGFHLVSWREYQRIP